MLEKTFSPDAVEAKHYARWEAGGAFAGRPESNARPFAIVIPPPNVTGSLHMGHALNNTLQDILVRWRRMGGRDALWMPGTDHAGIATQMVVERQLGAEGKSRHDLGRAAFIDRVWKWKAESGGTITRQLRRLGASCDWGRERFTMDDGLSHAVRKVFVDLHRQGLIYRAKRLVNWDPKLHTAISDLEVEMRETKGSLWHIRYPVEGQDGRFIVVATTRPETMLSDSAIAVHPEDARYVDLVGRHAVLPLVGRRLPIVADAFADPTFGSGAVKITPAHDFNDFAVGERHGLALYNIFDKDARLTGDVPEPYRGLDRFEARKRIVADLDAAGAIEKIEPHVHQVRHGDRSGVVIEPWLTDQWFVDAKALAGPCIEAVKSGRTVFVPRTWENTFFHWMETIQPWCISRQIWWGHQIPAWYGPDGRIFVAMDEAEAKAAARAHYGRDENLLRDEDVLDTWFSSALWPFSTMGWPADTPELRRYYPGDVLVTGFDIIFFWVARMMMMGLHFMKDVPFRTVYIHALVRDEKGQKMSKSKGNVLDPLDLIDKYGADAVRFTLAALAAQGRDVKLAESRIEGYRNFATKIWNAARFGQMNGCLPVLGFRPAAARATINRWLLGELQRAIGSVTAALEAFRFNDAANAAYQFVWGAYCDWYLELAKPVLQGPDGAAKDETRAVAAHVLAESLKLLHPFMPFVTEELWGELGFRRAGAGDLMVETWPMADAALVDEAADAEIGWLIRLVDAIRAVRAELNVPPGARVPLQVRDAGGETQERLARHAGLVATLARVSAVAPAPAGGAPTGAVPIPLDEATFYLPLAEAIDLGQERQRLKKEIDRIAGEIARLDKKLGNADFVAKAPAEVVDEQRQRRADYAASGTKLAEALKRLDAA
jgi:valyl-tRNA synthetase